jgi:hypothetical protein
MNPMRQVVALLLLTGTALAEPLPVPKPLGPSESPPHGYTSSGAFYVPRAGARDAVAKGAWCPNGFTSSGNRFAFAAPADARLLQ